MALPAGYEIRVLSNDEFFPKFAELRAKLFGENFDFNFREALSHGELEALHRLHKNMSQTFTLNLGLYFHGELVGWAFGRQESAEKFYMVNSAIYPNHRRKGLYTALMKEAVDRTSKEGFQILYSRHSATNSAILIPKLKFGFVISGMEISDAFGTLVHLSYFTNSLRRRMMEVRAGELRPDDELKKHLKLT